MKFLWKPTREAVSPTSVGTIAATDEGETRNCRSLSQVLERLFRQHERPSILDIGPFCGPSAIFLADLGARVTVEELDLDQPGLQAPSEENPNPPDVQIGTDGKFDFILAWECPDFVHPSRLAALGRALEQRVADDGWVLILAQNQGVGGAGNHTSTQSYRDIRFSPRIDFSRHRRPRSARGMRIPHDRWSSGSSQSR